MIQEIGFGFSPLESVELKDIFLLNPSHADLSLRQGNGIITRIELSKVWEVKGLVIRLFVK